MHTYKCIGLQHLTVEILVALRESSPWKKQKFTRLPSTDWFEHMIFTHWPNKIIILPERKGEHSSHVLEKHCTSAGLFCCLQQKGFLSNKHMVPCPSIWPYCSLLSFLSVSSPMASNLFQPLKCINSFSIFEVFIISSLF